jgi:hypothetical protein
LCLLSKLEADIFLGMQGENLNPLVLQVMKKLRSEMTRRFITEERPGHREDLLIATFLDPRFKHFIFPGSTLEIRQDAEKFVRAAYEADWSPAAQARAEDYDRKASREEVDSEEEEEQEEEVSSSFVFAATWSNLCFL